PPWPDRDDLRLHVGQQQQWVGLRRAGRQHAVVQHDAGAVLPDRPLFPHGARAGHRRFAGPQAARTTLGGDVPHRHAALDRSAHRRGGDRARADLLPRRRSRPRGRAPRRQVLRRVPMTMTSAAATMSAPPVPSGGDKRPKRAASLFDPAILRRAVGDSLRKLDPRLMARNPVMFVVEVGSVLTTLLFVRDVGMATAHDNVFVGLVAAWLWFTVLFANFAEAVAEGRGKAQADTLRKTRSETVAFVRQPDGSVRETPSSALQLGDCCVVEAGQLVPGDGEVIEGIASVDESAITGESAPVIRESGGDRSSVTGGTRVLSDRIVVRVSSKPGESFLDRMIALVEGASRQKTP